MPNPKHGMAAPPPVDNGLEEEAFPLAHPFILAVFEVYLQQLSNKNEGAPRYQRVAGEPGFVTSLHVSDRTAFLKSYAKVSNQHAHARLSP